MQHFLGQMIEMFRLELFLRLSLATLFGGAIGLERELGGKPAGLRTNILICIGSVLYTKLSITMAAGTADPTRVAAQIVTGGRFIGAGTILHARGAVVGLTSAATIWVVAAIGVALGAALYWEAAGTPPLVLLLLQGLRRLGLGRGVRDGGRASGGARGGGLPGVRRLRRRGPGGARRPQVGPYQHGGRRDQRAARPGNRRRAHELRRGTRRSHC